MQETYRRFQLRESLSGPPPPLFFITFFSSQPACLTSPLGAGAPGHPATAPKESRALRAELSRLVRAGGGCGESSGKSGGADPGGGRDGSGPDGGGPGG